MAPSREIQLNQTKTGVNFILLKPNDTRNTNFIWYQRIFSYNKYKLISKSFSKIVKMIIYMIFVEYLCLVTRTRKGEHITPVLFRLHWLPVHFKSLNGTAPVYLSDLIIKYILVRMLRSESYSLLRVPKSHTAIYGEKFFRASAPRLWNELPNHIKLAANKDTFCKVLKTHLFKLAYL